MKNFNLLSSKILGVWPDPQQEFNCCFLILCSIYRGLQSFVAHFGNHFANFITEIRYSQFFDLAAKLRGYFIPQSFIVTFFIH